MNTTTVQETLTLSHNEIAEKFAKHGISIPSAFQYRKICPALYGKGNHSESGLGYTNINVATEVIKYLRKTLGWEITHLEQRKARKHKKTQAPFMIRLAHHKDLKEGQEEMREIIITSSHDGKQAFKLHLGVFTFACANGLIVGEMDFTQKIVHKGFQETVQAQLDTMKQKLKEFTLDNWTNPLDQLRGQIMTPQQMREFAKNALEARGKMVKNPFEITDSLVDNLLAENEFGQNSNSVYDVFQRIQGRLIKPLDDNKAQTLLSGELKTNAEKLVAENEAIESKINLGIASPQDIATLEANERELGRMEKDTGSVYKKVSQVGEITRKVKLNKDLAELAFSFVN